MKRPLTPKIIPIQPAPIGAVGGRFFIFGLVLHPQDLTYLTLLLVLAAPTPCLFTAVAVEEKSTFVIPC